MKTACHTGSSNFGRVLGGIFLVIATLLTFVNVGSEGGTLGMYIVAAVLITKRSGCGTCERCNVCACVAKTCGSEACDAPVAAKKVSKPRKPKKTA